MCKRLEMSVLRIFMMWVKRVTVNMYGFDSARKINHWREESEIKGE